MQRRHFIKVSSAAMAALWCKTNAYGMGSPSTSLAGPDKVWIKVAGQWIPMMTGDATRFRYNDNLVTIRSSSDAMGVYLLAPSDKVQAVRFRWTLALPAQTLCLGDHWERSYGDAAWKDPLQAIKEPWYVLFHHPEGTLGYGVKTGGNSLSSWSFNKDGLELMMDTRSAGEGVALGGRELHAADIVTIKSTNHESPFHMAQRFCKQMCATPRTLAAPVYGINDWYYAYGNNSPALILEQAGIMTELATDNGNRPFSVIDAGWAAYAPGLPGDCCWGDDFSRPNDKFKDMQVLADQLVVKGMRPGLWTRPLCASYKDPTNVLLPPIPGRMDPKNPILDPTIEANMERIQNNFRLYKQWGYQLVKHDYTTYDITGKWGFEMMAEETSPPVWQFNDSTRTTAEVILHLYQSIREAAGELYVIGCNTISHLSAGLFEINRIGDDTSGKEWSRTRKMGVNSLGFRIHQQGAFYATDGDCVGLTQAIPWEDNKQWMQLLAFSGTPLFISAEPAALGLEQKAFIRNCFSKAAQPLPVGEPLDWLTNPLPVLWKLNGETVSFDWGKA